jgi:hypothetical protein
MNDLDNDVVDGVWTAHRLATLWRLVAFLLSFVLVAGFAATVPSGAAPTPCGEAVKPPLFVAVNRVMAQAGASFHWMRTNEPDPSQVQQRVHDAAVKIGEWLAILKGSTLGYGQHPEMARREAELQTQQEQHDLTCRPPDTSLLTSINPGGPGAAADFGQTYAGSPNVRIATMNVKVTAGSGTAVAAMGRVFRYADVVGGQEFSSEARRAAIRNAFGSKIGMTTDGTAVPIMWRTDRVRLLSQHEQQVMGSVHAEGGRLPHKPVIWAHFQELATKHTFWVVNFHLYWDIGWSGKPLNRPVRVGAYALQLRRNVDGYQSYPGVDGLSARGEAVMVTCDCNVDAPGDMAHRDPRFPFVMMNHHGFASSYQQLKQTIGTHGHASLDYVWSKGAMPVKQTILSGAGDHEPLAVEFSQARPVTA